MRNCHVLLLQLASLCLILTLTSATSVVRSLTFFPASPRSISVLQWSNIENRIFGFAPDNSIGVDVNISYSGPDELVSQCRTAMSICQIKTVRDISVQQRRFFLAELESTVEEATCSTGGRSRTTLSTCDTFDITPGGWSLPKEEVDVDPSTNGSTVDEGSRSSIELNNDLFILSFAVCGACAEDDPMDSSNPLKLDVELSVSMRNRNVRFPQLGYEEAWYPIFAWTTFSLLLVINIPILASIIYVLYRDLKIGVLLPWAMVAASLRLISSSITVGYFQHAVTSGFRGAWYKYVNAVIAGLADLSLTPLVLFISAGVTVVPREWYGHWLPHILAVVGVISELMLFLIDRVRSLGGGDSKFRRITGNSTFSR